jgi:hypothetical protein
MMNVIATAGIGLISGLGMEAAKRRGWLDWLEGKAGTDGREAETTRQVMGYVIAGEATPLAVRVDRAVALVRGGQRAVVERNLRAVDPTARVIARVILALPQFYWAEPSAEPTAQPLPQPAPAAHVGSDCAGPGHCTCEACSAATAANPEPECAEPEEFDDLESDEMPEDEIDCAELGPDEVQSSDGDELDMPGDDLDDLPDVEDYCDGDGWANLLQAPPACRTGCG